jgi:hypothetical protein
MAVFELEAPDGKTYEVEGADAAGAVAALKKMQGAQPSTIAGLGKAVDAGVASGIATLGGAVGDLTNLGAKGIGAATNWVERKLGMPESPAFDPSKSALRHIPTGQSMSDEIQKQYYDGAKPYEPQNKGEKILYAAGSFAPSVMVGPGGLISKALSTVGGGVGQVAGGDVAASLFSEGARPYGEFAGGTIGALSPAGAARVATPNPVAPVRQGLINTLQHEGVTSLTAGQRTGNKAIQYMEDGLGNAPGAGGNAARITREGQEQFTEAAMRRTGDGPNAGPEVLARNQQRLGDEFRDLSARNNLTPDNQFVTDLVQSVRQYRRVPDSQQRAMVQGYVDDIVQHVNAGRMPGPQYQEMRSRLSRQSHSLRQSDPTLSEALRDMRNALDDAMGRSIAPADQQAWQRARQQYGAQKDIEKAASRAGEATAEGQITPANLRNVASANNRGAYARGEGQFSELSRAGAGIMSPLPNSGTAQRYNALQLANQATLGAIPAMAGRVLMSRPMQGGPGFGQGYLANQLLTPHMGNLPSRQEALLRSLLATDQQAPLRITVNPAPSNYSE